MAAVIEGGNTDEMRLRQRSWTGRRRLSTKEEYAILERWFRRGKDDEEHTWRMGGSSPQRWIVDRSPNMKVF